MRSAYSRIAGFVLTTILVASMAGAAWAQLRTLPTTAKRAMLTGYADRIVTLGGENRRLAPGAVIFDTNNRSILPNFLPESADVVYTTDSTGAVMRIYLLTSEEQQRLDRSQR